MIELFHSPYSTCSQKVRLVLAEKALEWQSNIVDLKEGDHVKEDYLKLNPNGVVPTLVDNGHVIIDSSVINEYLEDVYADQSVRPGNPVDVAKMRAWRQYIDEVPTPTIRVPSFNTFFVRYFSNLTDEQLEEGAARRPLREQFYRKMGRTGFDQSNVDTAIAQLRQTLDRMEKSLATTSWLAGNGYTLADVSITPTIVRMEDLGLSHMWQDHPRVTDWYSRIKTRPNFDIAFMPGSRALADLGQGAAC